MSWRFPVTVISILLFTVALMVGILVLPSSLGVLSSFAEDFKVWCFGYDPSSGSLEWGYVWMFTIQPFIILFVIWFIWQKPLKKIFKSQPRAVVPYVVRSLIFVLILGISLPFIGGSKPAIEDVRSFPAESLRTSRMSHDFTLTDQSGQTFSTDQFRGRVVLLTAIYTSCGDTCPLILQQTKRVLQDVEQTSEENIAVVAITLDPDVDTPDMMAALFRAHGLDTFDITGATGRPDTVQPILDKYGFQRDRDPETGMLMHSNKLIAIDREGRIAYTFSLGSLQEEWLTEALRLLLSESHPV